MEALYFRFPFHPISFLFNEYGDIKPKLKLYPYKKSPVGHDALVNSQELIRRELMEFGSEYLEVC